ncbi:alpha/beta fold hydrolase [Flavobacterium sp. 3HN19-14]|uniref:alpha/beta fold hydrolase n=1 Tax=Flavobacterium sp. 3HN19-14 TaxID=3448133 RepID=UPI003EE392C0
MERKAILLIHGAGLDSTIWKKLKLNYPVIAANFPYRGNEKATEQLTFTDYVNAIIQQVEKESFDELIIVAHSIGGCVGLAVASHFKKSVSGFVAISAAIPKKGKSFASCLPFPKNILMPLFLRFAGTRPPKSAILKGLTNNLNTTEAESIANNFTPESKALYTEKCNAPISDVLKMYIVTDNDTEFLPETQQKMMINFNPQNILKIKSGHLPMLSHPEKVSEIINEFCAIL